MEPTDMTGIPQQMQIYVLYGMFAVSIIGKLLGSLTTGGGLKNILLNAWQGKSVPKAVAEDYKEELNSKPNP